MASCGRITSSGLLTAATCGGIIASRDFHAIVCPVDVGNACVHRLGAAIGADVAVFEIANVAVGKSEVSADIVPGGKLIYPTMLDTDFLGRDAVIGQIRRTGASVAHEHKRGGI